MVEKPIKKISTTSSTRTVPRPLCTWPLRLDHCPQPLAGPPGSAVLVPVLRAAAPQSPVPPLVQGVRVHLQGSGKWGMWEMTVFKIMEAIFPKSAIMIRVNALVYICGGICIILSKQPRVCAPFHSVLIFLAKFVK